MTQVVCSEVGNLCSSTCTTKRCWASLPASFRAVDEALAARCRKTSVTESAKQPPPTQELSENLHTIQALLLKLIEQGQTAVRVESLSLKLLAVCQCVIISGVIYAVLAWFFAQRHHRAWIALTIFSFNPVAWIINFIYLRRRWAEHSVATPTI
jgi:hypothetical protein